MRFLIALQFLTIIPVRIKKAFGEEELARSMLFFPIIGIILGLAIAGVQQSASLIFSAHITSVTVVTIIAILTGGLHLDGLADTADALFSSKGKEEKLRIMKSSHTGAMGATAITLSLLLKVTLISSIPDSIIVPTLIMFPAAGRCGLLLPALIFRYAREEGGTGEAFVTNLSLRIVFPAVLLTAVIAAGLLQLAGICALAVVFMAAIIAGNFIATKIGGMTGDTLGAINEGSEILFLAAICVAAGLNLFEFSI